MSHKRCSHLRHNMWVSTADATSLGIMVGVGETYLPAFALAVGMGEIVAGLVGSVPLLVGGLLQAISPWILRKGVSEKVWVVGASIVQGLAFLPLLIAAIVGEMSVAALMVCASLYWAGGLAGGPAWNSWIDKLIPKPVRANFFACRSRSAQITTACGFLGAGALLQLSRSGGWETQAFAILFALAWLARSYSTWMLAMHRTPEAKPERKLVALPARVAVAASALPSVSAAIVNPRTLITYLVLVQGMVQISGPFYAPYMLKHLSMSYLGFAILISAMFIAKIIALASWGRFAKRFGAQKLLLVGGILIAPSPVLWIFSSNYVWLVGVQIFSGIGWAAYELGFFLLLFDSVPILRRVRMLTIYNVANTSAWCCGAAIGGLLLYHLGANNFGYFALFWISGVGRGLAYLYFLAHCGSAGAAIQKAGMRLLRVSSAKQASSTTTQPSLESSKRSTEELAA